jgi:hypothetical protein
VCTTNPAAGRGVTTSLLQARQLTGLLEEHGRDFTSCSLAFDHWCARNIKPWFDDHVYWDTDLIRRWSGQDVDLTRPLPPDLVIAAAQADPGLIKVIGPYQAMLALPASLDAVQARARAIYASGWRPPIPPARPAGSWPALSPQPPAPTTTRPVRRHYPQPWPGGDTRIWVNCSWHLPAAG